MPAKGPKKRPAQAAPVSSAILDKLHPNSHGLQRPSKKRKVAEDGQPSKSKSKGKERAFDRPTIPIPNQGDEDAVELSEDDLNLLEEYGGAASFLRSLDEKGIARYVVIF